MNPIIVGADDSPASRRAFLWASEIARATASKLIAVSVMGHPWAEVSPDMERELIAEREQQLEEWTRTTVDFGGDLCRRVIPGDPRDALQSAARDESAGLIVVGRTGHGTAPGLLHVGSVGEHLAHQVQRPLAVVPLDAPTPVTQITVGVDGSAGSQRALEWCAGLAKSLGAHVEAVRIDDEPTEHPVHVVGDVVTSNMSAFDAECRPLSDAGVDFDQVVELDTSAWRGLLRLATDAGSDLLVVGARGRGGFSGLRAGGVAMKVLHHATLPIVLVPDR